MSLKTQQRNKLLKAAGWTVTRQSVWPRMFEIRDGSGELVRKCAQLNSAWRLARAHASGLGIGNLPDGNR